MLSYRYDRHGGLTTLETARDHAQHALRFLHQGHADRPGAYAILAGTELQFYQLSGELDVLDRAVRHARRAVAEGVPEDPRMGGFRSNLATFLMIRYARTGSDDDLDEAVELGRTAAATYQGPQRVLALGALLGTLTHLVNRRSDMAALDEALEVVREILETAGPRSPHRVSVLGNVTAALRVQHLLRGDEDSAALDQALPLQRELLDVMPPAHPETAIHVTNLAELLILRWRALAAREDLEAAERLMRESDTTPATRYSAQLGATRAHVFRAIAEAQLDQGELQDAARTARDSITAAQRLRTEATGHPLLAGRAAIFEGNAWIVLHGASRNAESLAKAEECFREAALLMQPDDPQRGVVLGNLGFVRLDSLPDVPTPGDLNPVIALLREAVEAFPGQTRFSEAGARAVTNLGAALLMRYEAVRDPATLGEALDLSLEIVGSERVPWRMRLGNCTLAADALMLTGDPVTAAEWYERAVRLLPFTAWRGADRSGTETMLGPFAGLGRDAAAAVLRAEGEPARALSLLEAGRAVLWARTVELQGRTTSIQRSDPEVAERLTELGRLLEAVDDPAGEDGGLLDGASRRTDRRTALSQEYRRLTAEVVAAGNGGFLEPPAIADLLAAAAHGPVVVVNVSQWGCDAFVVTSEQITSVPLPGLTVGTVERWARQHLSAHAELQGARHERLAAQAANARVPGLAGARREQAARSTEVAAARAWSELLDAILRDLWDIVAEPVLHMLPVTEDGARLWWCPTGPLALLPLHAAGHHEQPDGSAEATAGAPRTLLDRFTCSIIPTVMSLARAHRDTAAASVTARADGPEMLVVALPNTPGQSPLPDVEHERDVLRGLWPASRLTCLEGAGASRAAVATALRSHPRAHIGCHGMQNADRPSAGGLALHDGLLTVRDIASARHFGDFVMLSACQSVTVGSALPDEVISLGAALHVTGYRHVIGAQWSVDTLAASRIAEDVHQILTGPGGTFDAAHSAEALRLAALRLRADSSQSRHSWVAFTHTGP
ncbi:CHAT domain-containing protein [Streptomyces sp. NBC_00988]|uniref:CHAT domain-containing tetratricopeptide repeat protein n=1 Tax=Streptomyces sp. NBC_00988 TaxID=2903704 RepID=UPI00386E9312|nr:CHAT domain-containing protein [Streptomyces sp. NBC_00988]